MRTDVRYRRDRRHRPLRFDRARVAAELGRAGGYRLTNPRLPAAELEAVARLLKQLGVVAV